MTNNICVYESNINATIVYLNILIVASSRNTYKVFYFLFIHGLLRFTYIIYKIKQRSNNI